VKFHPDSLADNVSASFPPIAITDFTIINAPDTYQQQIFNADTVSLSFKDNYFQIKFANLDYHNTDNTNYYYKLKGIDRNWIYSSGKDRIASYNNIPPGEYDFVVRSTNNAGKWNEEAVSLHVIVTPLYYQTWWFRGVSLLLLFTLLLLMARYGYQQFTFKQKQLENKLMQQKQEADEPALYF